MSDKPIRIWVVDDNPGNVYRFREALDRTGMNSELLAIRDGVEALALIRLEEASGGASVPDLVVLDSSLPEADGVEVLEAMRQSDVPVVITSRLISPRDRAGKIEEFFQVAASVKQVPPAGHPEKQTTPLRSRRVDRFQTEPIDSCKLTPTGKRFTLAMPAIAIDTADGKRAAVTIPAEALVEVISSPRG
jgi:CheY-like chemotaxis protein